MLSVTTDAAGHAYADEGSYGFIVTVINVHASATGHGQGSVTVGEGDALTVTSGRASMDRLLHRPGKGI
jgi:hypothetical protein